MNYQKIHDQLIDRARPRVYDRKIHHNHHIIPMHEDCFSTETVPLTYKEHMVIHHLRWKIAGTVGNKLAYLRFKNMKEEFYKERAIAGGKTGGKNTKIRNSGIFSPDHDRSAETKKRWKDGVITKECLNMTHEKARDRGLKSSKSGKGIYSPDYDRSAAAKNNWQKMDQNLKDDLLSQLKSRAKEAGCISRDNKKGFHSLSNEERMKNCSKGGKAHTGKIWVNKNNVKTRINKDMISEYLENGWSLGTKAKGNSQ